MKVLVLLACAVFATPVWSQPKIKEQQRLEKERNFRKANKLRSKSEFKILIDGAEILEKTLVLQEIYDENGFLVQSIEPQTEDSIRTIYQYTPQGFETSHTVIGFDVIPIEYRTVYDESGRKTEGSVASAEVRRYKYIYDKQDNLVRQEGYTVYDLEQYENDEWTLVDIDSFLYDNKGNIAEKISFYMGEEVWRMKYTYDGQDRLIKSEAIRSENVEFTDEYIYDELGRATTHTSTDSEGVLTFVYEYEYFE